MYVCLCNPFTDRDVKSALDDSGVRKTPGQVYKACTGGQKPCCGTCLCMLREMVANHESEAEAADQLIAAE